ncbi:endoproteinase ArgC [Acidovorax sp. JG5]|uniref:trypsin-like peptidase domain-containing protein n=1 Tax=Acidovorax sp. JG5 TaxID=2822718 RepID=UPI001B3346E6|nr:trypsin-like peptidase domain-containing protein [Acidovorax sp. JG5]MBP3979722.1 endoproteinase ArgC [Acidovorax sp. JG5]
MKLHHSMPWMCAVGAALLVAACGGGGGGGSPAPDASAADRIEPFDPSLFRPFKLAVTAPRADGYSPQATVVQLGPLAVPVLQSLQKKAGPIPGNGMRQQIGLARGVVATATSPGLQGQLHWYATERGTQRAAISFEAQGALGVRLGVLVRALPAGSTLRFYAQAGEAVVEMSGEEVLGTIARNLQAGDTGDAARTYWSPDFSGAETTLELELPANADLTQLDIAVPTLSHFYLQPERAAQPSLTDGEQAGSCNIDVSCRPEYSSESRSVARMLFVENGSTFLCTGTLLNDVQSSATPYFLSASHCISTQSAASTLTTDWFFRSAACNSSQVNMGAQRLNGGATLLYAEESTDTAFMRLNAAPPAGIVFAGSYFGAVVEGSRAAGIHHPLGDLQKLSEGTVKQFDNCTLEACLASTPQDGRFLTVGWQAGTAESGSSGSGLFLPIGTKRYVAGQLLGGAASCQNPSGLNYYGRYDLAFQAALKNWLKPAP